MTPCCMRHREESSHLGVTEAESGHREEGPGSRAQRVEEQGPGQVVWVLLTHLLWSWVLSDRELGLGRRWSRRGSGGGCGRLSMW